MQCKGEIAAEEQRFLHKTPQKQKAAGESKCFRNGSGWRTERLKGIPACDEFLRN